MREPLPAHKRAEILVRVVSALARRHDEVARLISRRGGQADEGSAGRGQAGDVDLHVRRGRGAQARRRDGADGRRAGGRGQARVHAAQADRDRRRDLAVQLPAQPRRAQARPRAGRGLCGRAQAREPDSPLGTAARRAGRGSRPAAGLAQRRCGLIVRDRRRAGRGRARQGDHVHRLRRRRLGAEGARAEEEGQPRARQRDAGDRHRRRRSRRGRSGPGREQLLVRGAELHLGAADLRRAGCLRRAARADAAAGRGASRRRPGRRGDRRRPGDRRGRQAADPRVDRGGALGRRRGAGRRRRARRADPADGDRAGRIRS